MSLRRLLFDTGNDGNLRSLGLLLLRVAAGGLLSMHGLAKLQSYGERAATFPDPLGVGGPASMALVVFAELFCAFAVLLGFATRLATIPVIVTMLVAAFVIHAGDPLKERELALIYLVVFAAILLTGPGRLSIDQLLSSR